MTISSRSGDVLSGRSDHSTGPIAETLPDTLTGIAETNYEPPAVLDVGTIRDLVKGSSSSGNSDANSQYYW